MSQLTENEARFLIWVVIALIAIFAYIAGLGVSALIRMSKDITAIKITVTKVATEHAAIEKRVSVLESSKPKTKRSCG